MSKQAFSEQKRIVSGINFYDNKNIMNEFIRFVLCVLLHSVMIFPVKKRARIIQNVPGFGLGLLKPHFSSILTDYDCNFDYLCYLDELPII